MVLVVVILLVEIILLNRAQDQALSQEGLDEDNFPSLVHCHFGTDITKASLLILHRRSPPEHLITNHRTEVLNLLLR